MSALGNSASMQVFQPAIDYFSGNGATSQFTLSRPVASVAQIIVSVANVIQNPNTFSVNNNILTLGGNAPVGTNNVWVQYQTAVIQVNQPGQGTVGTTQMMDAAVTAAKIADSTITPSKLTVGAISWDSSGRVAMPYQPSVTIQKINFVQGGSSWNEVTGYGSAQHNIGSHFNTTTGKFTCPVAGKYLVTCNQRSTDGSGQDNAARIQLWVNGANSMNGDYWAAYAASYAGSVRGTVSASNVFNCYAGDTLSAATYAGASIMTHVLSVTYLG